MLAVDRWVLARVGPPHLVATCHTAWVREEIGGVLASWCGGTPTCRSRAQEQAGQAVEVTAGAADFARGSGGVVKGHG